jgi:hypothetical protein
MGLSSTALRAVWVGSLKSTKPVASAPPKGKRRLDDDEDGHSQDIPGSDAVARPPVKRIDTDSDDIAPEDIERLLEEADRTEVVSLPFSSSVHDSS